MFTFFYVCVMVLFFYYEKCIKLFHFCSRVLKTRKHTYRIELLIVQMLTFLSSTFVFPMTSSYDILS